MFVSGTYSILNDRGQVCARVLVELRFCLLEMEPGEQEAFGLPAIKAIDHDAGDVDSNKSEPVEVQCKCSCLIRRAVCNNYVPIPHTLFYVLSNSKVSRQCLAGGNKIHACARRKD